MTVAPPETLTLDRIATPIGVALVVTDAAGVLRAFNWTDYEADMMLWLGRRLPTANLHEGVGPLRRAFDAYFAGDLDSLGAIRWIGAGTAFQQRVWQVLCEIPVGATWSYAELDSWSNRLANQLIADGIKPQDVVAIYAHRSAALVWALLGLLKAGAAFMILDPAYPAARLLSYLRLARPRG